MMAALHGPPVWQVSCCLRATSLGENSLCQLLSLCSLELSTFYLMTVFCALLCFWEQVTAAAVSGSALRYFMSPPTHT